MTIKDESENFHLNLPKYIVRFFLFLALSFKIGLAGLHEYFKLKAVLVKLKLVC